MNYDDHPDLIREMLADLRGQTPSYSDDVLEAGFAAVLAEVDTLDSAGVDRTRLLAEEAELGAHAHALGLEHFERGNLTLAIRWLRTAVRYGVPEATGQLEDARELHAAVSDTNTLDVSSDTEKAEQESFTIPSPDSARIPLPSDSSWRDSLHKSDSGQRAAQRAAEQEIAYARHRADSIISDARQEAHRIIGEAQRQAHHIIGKAQHDGEPPESATTPTHESFTTHAPGTGKTSAMADFVVMTNTVNSFWEYQRIEAKSFHPSTPKRLRERAVVVWADSFDLVIPLFRTPRAATSRAIWQHLLGTRCPESFTAAERALINLVGKEMAHAYWRAREEEDTTALASFLDSDNTLTDRLQHWAQTMDHSSAARTRNFLANRADKPSRPLLLPPQHQQTRQTGPLILAGVD
ncbi:hypothetical protein SAMN06297387_12822 [Streptomyces zhaozhouensis]|uniref:Uncharacterized protein n=1 Tax=Streptomyces zhaozhouensis TaxID=1300267 RepID=A0A286E7X0_9ACTN|nr:ATP synthase F0 subunit B [Streptomyces zhaozhouensis]SOD66981.1 hypothetical protein SAMN06297387_12822 [Streptomyces zhaozhouensis]